MRRAYILTLSALIACTGAAQVQTAYGSPTAPAPAGLPGIPPGISRIAPSEGHPRTDVFGNPIGPGAQGPAVADMQPSARFGREQRAIDRETVICQGCD